MYDRITSCVVRSQSVSGYTKRGKKGACIDSEEDGEQAVGSAPLNARIGGVGRYELLLDLLSERLNDQAVG